MRTPGTQVMTNWVLVLDHQATVRVAVLLGILGLMATWEVLAARRQLTVAKANAGSETLASCSSMLPWSAFFSRQRQ